MTELVVLGDDAGRPSGTAPKAEVHHAETPLPDAVHRRARDELGVAVGVPRPVLPDFRYRAVMDNGVVENEICPVFVARLHGPPRPAPEEVAEFRWTGVRRLHRELRRDDGWFSPWAARQLAELAAADPRFGP